MLSELEQNHSKLDIYRHSHSEIVVTSDGKLYRVEEISPIDLRRQVNQRRNQRVNRFSWIVLGVGGVFVGLAGLLIFGAVLAAATRPAPPVVNPNCWIGCSANAN